ncbi:MAG: hypothetical protein JHC52_09975 [Chthoniobacterales bacterium]|nr:hypothetical protein [Chthoniobacterales bacterium]
MKNVKTLALTMSTVAFALSTPAIAQTNIVTNYSSGSGITQFNTNAGYYSRGDSLDGTPIGANAADQWQTTDPYNPTPDTGGTSQMQWVPAYTGGEGPSGADAGNNSVYWGGYDVTSGVLPGINKPRLYHDFVQSYSTLTADPATRLISSTFRSDFALFASAGGNPGYTNNDTFGYSFWTAGGPATGAFLAAVQFTNINATDFGVSLDGDSVGTLAYGSIYSLQAVFNSNNVLTVSAAGVTAQTNGSGTVTNFLRAGYVALGSTNLAAGTTDSFESASIDWDLASANPALPGANYMLIESVEIASAVTPEPGTVLAGVLLLGTTVYTAVRRRRQAKNKVIA